jgi:hypothetical protein
MPNQFSTQITVTSSAGWGVTFPWRPDTLVLSNDGASPVYVTLLSSAATTNDYRVNAGESLNLVGRTLSLGAICSSSDASVRVGAWQWALAAVTLLPLFVHTGVLG